MNHFKRCGNGWIDLGLPAVLSDEISFQQLLYNVVHNLSELHDNFQDLYDYTINFLQSLDIDLKVKEYLNKIVEDGTLADLINIELLNKKVQKKHTLNSLFFQQTGVPDAEISANSITNENYQNFLKEMGVPYIPEGNYTNVQSLSKVRTGKIGNGKITDHSLDISTKPKNLVENLDNDALIVHEVHTINEKSKPIIAVSNVITDDLGGSDLETCGAGIYSFLLQNGKNTRLAPKAVVGVSINDAGGDNDSTGVVGYSYKTNVSSENSSKSDGIGDCAGAGGAAWQYSTQAGLVMGGEFSCHQNVAGTTSNDGATGQNKSCAIHVTTASSGSPCANAILFDSKSLTNAKTYGFWNLLNFAPSAISQKGVGNGIEGTTIFNTASMSDNFPDNVFKLGNANRHIFRENGNVRIEADGLDLFDHDYNNFGLRLIGSQPFLAFYSGSAGSDGKYQTKVKGSVTSTANGAIAFRSYDTTNPEDETSLGFTISKELSSLFPTTTNAVNLGRPTFLWKDIYASNSVIQTSDRNCKNSISEIDDKIITAWENVHAKKFKFNDAVKEKGEKARWHFGYIAQDVIEEFKKVGLDAFQYGIVCELKTEAREAEYSNVKVIDQPAIKNDSGEVLEEEKFHFEKILVSEATEAKTELALRYEECFVLEMECLKRKIDKLINL